MAFINTAHISNGVSKVSLKTNLTKRFHFQDESKLTLTAKNQWASDKCFLNLQTVQMHCYISACATDGRSFKSVFTSEMHTCNSLRVSIKHNLNLLILGPCIVNYKFKLSFQIVRIVKLCYDDSRMGSGL